MEVGRFDMKTHNLIVIGVTLSLALFPMSVNAQDLDKEALKAEIKEELKEELKGEAAGVQGGIQFSGLIEFGGVWQNVKDGTDVNRSDLALTTVELTLEGEVNDWTNVEITLLYEDETFGDEAGVDLDAAVLSIAKEGSPLSFSVGAMYVPFGALLTHFPDAPLIDAPLTLMLGEIREKAVLLGVEHQGFSLSGYLFNGDMDETGQENQVESYGLDANYSLGDEGVWDILIGASYISNIADSDGLEEALAPVGNIVEYIGGFDAYLHVGYGRFFFDAEYMTATDDFKPTELATGGQGAQPAVWNLEIGYNLSWGRNLEIALKCAGSDESGALGFPKERYGIVFNQEIFEGAIVSLAYLNDDYEDDDIDGRDDRDVVYGQIAIEF